MGWFEDATGYTDVTDMFDGGGAGGSGDTYYSGSHSDYVASGGTGGVANNSSGGSSNSGSNSGSSGSNTNTATIDGNTVTTTGTPGEGNFFVYDDTFIDPYEYVDLINAGYSDNAAFDLSYYSESDDPDNPVQNTADEEWYKKNPTSTITPEQYQTAKRTSTVLGLFAGPIGLGYRAITELQRRGKIPGNTAAGWFENKGIAETTGSSSDDKINSILNSDLSEAEQNDAIEDLMNTLITDQQLAGITAGMQSISNEAYGDTNLDNVSTDAASYVPESGLEDSVPTIDADATGTNIDSDQYNQPEDGTNADLTQVTNTGQVSAVNSNDPTGYSVETSADQIKNSDFYTAEAAQGTVTDDAQVVAEQLDIDDTASGINAVGKALLDFGKINISRVIDTSTVQGKLLAESLGEGEYVDSKATILGQMKLISDEFKDGQGNPKIPAWAQGQARNVQKTIAFSGMTGTAATAAMSNAIMEASLGVAEKEAQFFQTLTVKNLDNKQEAVINKANILSKFELANLDARMTAAVQNAQAFLKMDMANLDNKQQSEILNTQVRVDALLQDSKAKNAERLFTAQAENDFTKFYDELAVSIDRFNTTQQNEMMRFNAGEANDSAQFNATLDNDREQFYKEMQYNIDLANAKWRQSVTLEEASMKFEAAKFDTQNIFNLTSDALNRVWDREDSIFDYIWKSSETEKERLVDLYEVDKEFEAEMRKQSSDENYKSGQADWELFKWGWDVVSGGEDGFDIWDIW